MHRIRTRLLGAILLAALVPVLPTILLVHGLLERSHSAAVQDTLRLGLEAGMEESRLALAASRRAFLAAVDSLAAGGAAGLVVLDRQGSRTTGAVPPAAALAALEDAVNGPILAAEWLVMRRPGAGEDTLLAAQPLAEGAAQRAGHLAEALATAAALRLDRSAVLRGYLVPFLLVYAVLLLGATSLAILLARGVVGPLAETARAADRVAGGDLGVRVSGSGPGEVGALVRAFNGMVARLGRQRHELARLEKLAAWRDLARILAHEIKNPLTPILLAVQEARNSYRGDDQDHATVLETCESIVREEVSGLQRLVASFSDFARSPRLEPREEDLRLLVEDLDRLYGGRLSCELPDGALICRCDAEALRRALVNLVDNGLGACARSGRPERVILRVAAGQRHLQLEVIDEGEGIPADQLERVFDPDFSTRGGMGLGLAIARGIVEGHGGTIELDSVPHLGTTATVRLPDGATGERS